MGSMHLNVKSIKKASQLTEDSIKEAKKRLK